MATFLLMISFQASADIMHYTLCSLNEGKTIDDAQAWLDDWRALVNKHDISYSARLLLPHASTEQIGQFYIEGSSPTMSTYAAAWDWWYYNEDAAPSNAQLVDVAACGQNAVYVTTD